ncbi:hypothetical protein DIE07_04720 [Burkholderia sp. Bp9002]|nr:hypothetical protein DIE07_04720 [Burkholderia sp. Bp9002]
MSTDTNAQPSVNATFLVGVAAVCAAVFAFNFSRYGMVKDSFIWTIRVVVKLGFVFYTMSYIASPLHQLLPTGFSTFLMKHRATTGAAFAVSHLSAAGCAITLWVTWPQVIYAISNPVERVLGLTVFAWILVMLLTSNRASIGLLGQRFWHAIHTYGMMVIWVGYLLDYGRRTLHWSPYFGIFTGTLVLIFVLRLTVNIRRLVRPSMPARV